MAPTANIKIVIVRVDVMAEPGESRLTTTLIPPNTTATMTAAASVTAPTMEPAAKFRSHFPANAHPSALKGRSSNSFPYNHPKKIATADEIAKGIITGRKLPAEVPIGTRARIASEKRISMYASRRNDSRKIVARQPLRSRPISLNSSVFGLFKFH